MVETPPSSPTQTSAVHIEKTADSTSTFTRCGTPSINLRPSECEMQTLDRNDTTSRDHVQDTTKYPRVDGGKDAWLFLAGCFVFEALVWGKFP